MLNIIYFSHLLHAKKDRVNWLQFRCTLKNNFPGNSLYKQTFRSDRQKMHLKRLSENVSYVGQPMS